MYRLNIPVPPDEDFPEVVVAQRMGEGFEKEHVEYEPRWRFDKRRRAVVVDGKFFYAMADTADRLESENARLRELVRDMWTCILTADKSDNAWDECPRCSLWNGNNNHRCEFNRRMKELGVGI